MFLSLSLYLEIKSSSLKPINKKKINLLLPLSENINNFECVITTKSEK